MATDTDRDLYLVSASPEEFADEGLSGLEIFLILALIVMAIAAFMFYRRGSKPHESY